MADGTRTVGRRRCDGEFHGWRYGFRTSLGGGEWLVHLAAHLSYHLGQVDYHRRLVTGRGETVGTMAIPELRSARRPPDPP